MEHPLTYAALMFATVAEHMTTGWLMSALIVSALVTTIAIKVP